MMAWLASPSAKGGALLLAQLLINIIPLVHAAVFTQNLHPALLQASWLLGVVL